MPVTYFVDINTSINTYINTRGRLYRKCDPYNIAQFCKRHENMLYCTHVKRTATHRKHYQLCIMHAGRWGALVRYCVATEFELCRHLGTWLWIRFCSSFLFFFCSTYIRVVGMIMKYFFQKEKDFHFAILSLVVVRLCSLENTPFDLEVNVFVL